MCFRNYEKSDTENGRQIAQGCNNRQNKPDPHPRAILPHHHLNRNSGQRPAVAAPPSDEKVLISLRDTFGITGRILFLNLDAGKAWWRGVHSGQPTRHRPAPIAKHLRHTTQSERRDTPPGHTKKQNNPLDYHSEFNTK